jgi:putative ABC transport system ATP-binding protein
LELGESYSIIGPSGSGKSTLLNIIGLLDRPSGGHYWLQGVDTTQVSDAQISRWRCQLFGFVFQDFHLLARRSVIENVMLGALYTGISRAQRWRRANDLIGVVGLKGRTNDPVGQLSGGERQRVAIARALINEPKLLLCDEPTGNLDSVAADGITQLILNCVSPQTAVIIVTHDQQLAARCRSSWVVRDGQVSPNLSIMTSSETAFTASGSPVTPGAR